MANQSKKLIWIIVAIVVGIILGLIVNYRNDSKKVYVKLGTDMQLSIYKDLGGDAAYNYDARSLPLFKLDASETVKLKKSVYVFVVNDPSHQYEDPITKVVVSDDTDSIVIKPFFNSNKLKDLLNGQLPAIQQALLSQYPSLSSFYTIGSDHLYEYGDWYGAVLSPLSPQVDKLHVIMERKNGNWRVVAKPQISIGIPSNSFIPSQIVDSVDQL